ncbi:MAG: DUF3078 domain-containing protein [Ignavibacteriales bacterium]|nr:DUF3078 domain-containing protein [Ignavibacteriales bacterium]
MKKLFVLLFAAFAVRGSAQTPAPAPPASDTSWKHSVVSSVTMTQVKLKDWSAGGEDAVSWTARLDGKSILNDTAYVWGNTYKMVYGQAKLGSGDVQKVEDRIEFESVYTYKLGIHVNPYVGASLRTQFTEGVTTDVTGKIIPVSQFFDPAYLIQSMGFGYQPVKEVRTRLGAALREIVTSKYRQYANAPSVPVADWVKTSVDGGIESITDVEWRAQADVLVRSNLDLFAPIRKISEMTMRMDNSMMINIAKYLVVVVNLQLINDLNASTRTQVKEVLAFGLTYTLF